MFKAWQEEEVIFLQAFSSVLHNYLLVVYRTCAIVY